MPAAIFATPTAIHAEDMLPATRQPNSTPTVAWRRSKRRRSSTDRSSDAVDSADRRAERSSSWWFLLPILYFRMVTTLSLAQRASKLKLWSASIPAMEMFKMLLWRRSQIKIDFEIYEVVGDNNRRVARQRDVDAVPMPPHDASPTGRYGWVLVPAYSPTGHTHHHIWSQHTPNP
jgi:hypothetical protein